MRATDQSGARHLGKRSMLKWGLAVAVLLVIAAVVFLIWFFNLIPGISYAAADFGIETILSEVDANENGIDDYTDILLGARLDAQNRPRYDGSYHVGGYPPPDTGVCTDVVWRALAHAGYDFKAMMDADIASHPERYPGLDPGGPDPNIDFRRVRNIGVFLELYAQPLTLDLARTDEWQPGDLVLFAGGTDHIGIVSDKRNRRGVPYLIHNGGQPRREENALEKLAAVKTITGHYRWTGAVLQK